MGRSQHKETARKCPGCGKKSAFPERNETCSRECARVVAARDRAEVEPARLVADAALKAENTALRKQIDKVLASQVSDARIGSELDKALSRPLVVPRWLLTPRKTGKKNVVAMAKFSDWHFGEQVEPAEVRFMNGFGPVESKMRLENFPEGVLRLCFDYMQGFEYDGLVLPMLGDIVTGDIHEELRETNSAPSLAVVLEYAPLVAAAIKQLADHFGRVFVPVITGNHGRTTKRPRFKQRVETNLDFLFGELVARALEDDKRITVALPRSAKYIFSIYQTTFMASHGDEARGGGGIAGLLSPLMIADARMRKTIHYDYWILGHWHQVANFKRIEVNGSGKGYDEYSLGSNFDHEWPQQDLSIIDPRYGPVCHWPIRVFKAGQEEWMADCPLPIPGGDPKPEWIIPKSRVTKQTKKRETR